MGQSPNYNRDATVWTHKAAFLLTTDLLREAKRDGEERESERKLKCMCVSFSVGRFTEGLWAVQKKIPQSC